MTYLVASSPHELKNAKELIDYSIPKYRQAYSDRTSWLMACLSELAYIKFNPFIPSELYAKHFMDKVQNLLNKKQHQNLGLLFQSTNYDLELEKEKLSKNLLLLNMRLVATFDNQGTQALLVTNGHICVLAFRGTELHSLQDIKSDINSDMRECVNGGHVHVGFNDAYEAIAIELEQRLKYSDVNHLPLYITGHSLGGAVATIAAKRLKHQAGIAACYTFGSPRVADPQWGYSMKTPVYRIVNSFDCVPSFPPSGDASYIISKTLNYIPFVGPKLSSTVKVLAKNYMHCGNMRYITHCNLDSSASTNILYNVSLFYRFRQLIVNKLPFTNSLKDHSIKQYRKKLAVIAMKRNK